MTYRRRGPFDSSIVERLINPTFRSTSGNPFKDPLFMDAAKGISEGTTPSLLKTPVGLVIVRGPTDAPIGVSPRIELLGIVVNRIGYSEEDKRIDLPKGHKIVDVLSGRYVVRPATDEEWKVLAPELEKQGCTWLGMKPEQKSLATAKEAAALPEKATD